MKQKYKWIWFAAMLVCVALLAGCGAGQDDVSDPLAGFGVDAVVPFATKDATMAPSASPSPSASAMAPIATVTQGWQTEVVPTPVPTSETYAQLARGNTGDTVKRLQQRLKDLGYLSDSADGNFGTNTETAVKRFQQAIGLTQTGVASTYMQQRLFASDAPRYSGSTSTTAPTRTPSPTANASRPTATPSADLRYGDRGTAVLALQNRLKSLGYLTGSVDGIYGAQTRDAVMKFEQAYGRTQTGVATEAMQEVLYSDNARTYQQAFGNRATPTPTASSTGYTLLSYGSKGDAVKRLQARLVELGYLQSTVTGNYMNKTVEAVSKFQRAIGLSETGVATASLQEILFSSSAPRYNASTPTPTPSGGYTQLSFGNTGQAVAEMQQRLIDLGYLSGSADGLYYQATVEAVKEFQEALGWTPTGIASSDVLAVLFSPAAPSKTPSSGSSSSGYTELSIGSQGTAVYALQSRLVALGYASGQPSSSGTYGQATADAVKRFQQALGWEQTGIATVELQERLYAADAPVYAPAQTPTAAPILTPAPTTGLTTYHVLQEGNSGEDVAALQARLVELGYASGTANGTYGTMTSEAVMRFQTMIGFYSQTDMGVATVALQQILYSPYAPRYEDRDAFEVNTYEPLEYGSSGTAVYNLKARLQQLGYLGTSNPGYEDIFDENTLFAITNVQLALGVQETDGVATPELQAFLFSDAGMALSIAS